MIFFFAILFMFYVVMYPAIHSQSSSEMQTAYYILVVPNSLKVISSYSFIGLLIVVPLYYKAKLLKQATLKFEEDKVYILGRKISIDIAVSRIEKVYCNDLKNAFDEPKGILQVVIQQKGGAQTTFRLKEYEHGGELIEAVGTLQGVTLAGYDREMVAEHDDE